MAWRELVNRYQRLVYSIPQRYGLEAGIASEVFTATFSELWRCLDRLDQPEFVRAWLATVARRRSLAALREQSRWVSLDQSGADGWQEPTDPAPAGDEVLIAAEREQTMRDAIQDLPERCRELLGWLFFTEPVPAYDEIARRLGVSRNSIGFLRSRCLKKLKQAFHAQTPDSSARRPPL